MTAARHNTSGRAASQKNRSAAFFRTICWRHKVNLSFSTKGLDARLRPQYWNEVVCSYCVPAHSRIDSPQDFNGTFSARQIGDLVVSSMSAPQHKWERTATHMRRDPNETFLLSLMKSGTGQISQFGRSTSVGK